MNQPQEKPRLGVVRENPQQRLRILVVNDDDVVSSVLRSGFEPVGIVSLKIVPNAETAIRVLSAEPYDLLAVDPAISSGGFALLKHVKDHYRWTATLLATHNQDPQFLRQAVKCRIDGLLFRPTTSTEFVEQALLLAEAVNARRRRQQKRVLAIGAHPDDVEIGCGGALAKHHADHDVLHILTLSRGAAGGDVNIRVVEAHNAAALVGARSRWRTSATPASRRGGDDLDHRGRDPRAAGHACLHAFARGHAPGPSRGPRRQPGGGTRRAQRLLLPDPVLDGGVQAPPLRRHHALHREEDRPDRRLQEPGRPHGVDPARHHRVDGALLGPLRRLRAGRAAADRPPARQQCRRSMPAKEQGRRGRNLIDG